MSRPVNEIGTDGSMPERVLAEDLSPQSSTSPSVTEADGENDIGFEAAVRLWGQQLAPPVIPNADSAGTDPLECRANEVGIRFNAPIDTIRRSLERLCEGLLVLDPSLSVCDEAGLVAAAVSLLSDAIEVIGWEQVTSWIENNNPATLLNRCFVTEYLARRGGDHRVLLFSRAELADRLELLQRYLEADRQSLLQAGLPSHSFAASERLCWWLGPLYPTRRTMSPWPSMEHADNPQTGWARLDDAPIGVTRVACALVDADLIHGLTVADATRLKNLRPTVLNLKMEILDAAVRQLRQPFPQEFWSGCLASIVQMLSIEDANFLLQVDRQLNELPSHDCSSDEVASLYSLSELDPVAWSLSGYDRPFQPGGLTNIFEFIGHIEKEFTITTMGRTRDALGELIVNQHGDQLLKLPRRRQGYFGFIGRRSQPSIDRAIDIFCACDNQEAEFWRAFHTRLTASLANDLGQRVAIELLVPPRHAEEVRRSVATFGEWVTQHLRNFGSLPPLESKPSSRTLEKQPVVPADQSPPPRETGDCVLRKRDRDWIFRFSGGAEFVLLNTDGLLYLQHILTHPNTRHDPRALYGMKTIKNASDRRATTIARESYSSNGATTSDNSMAANPDALDELALRGYKNRLDEIESEIETARNNHDHGTSSNLEEERSQLLSRLQNDIHRGKVRRLGTTEKKKTKDKVRAAIKVAISSIRSLSPVLGKHLEDCFDIDILCYGPPTPRRWET